jgi:phosphoglycolate phosphatase-like HAD superfamily hydrolase
MTPQSRPVLVIFDLVSTLTDAAPRYVQAFKDVCDLHGKPAPSAEELQEMLGNKNLAEITEHFIGPMDATQKKQFMAECNHACDALLTQPTWTENLYPHVKEAIETLSLRGVTLGIYTGTREDALEAQLAYHDIGDFFNRSFVRGKDNVRDAGQNNRDLKAKQLRDIVQAFRTQVNNPQAQVIVIGDSKTDAQAAADDGLLFVGFAADETKRDKMQKAGVENIMRDFGDLPDMVTRLVLPRANDNEPAPQQGAKPRPTSGGRGMKPS